MPHVQLAGWLHAVAASGTYAAVPLLSLPMLDLSLIAPNSYCILSCTLLNKFVPILIVVTENVF